MAITIFLYSHLGVNGTFWLDYQHRRWRDVLTALKRSGLTTLVLGVTIILNLSTGPWKGQAWFGTLTGSAESYFGATERTLHRCPLFVHFYERLSRDNRNFSDSTSFGTEAHMMQVREVCKQSNVFKNKFGKVKLSRWFTFFKALEIFIPSWHAVALVTNYWIILRGLIKTASELPCFKVFASVPVPGVEEGQEQVDVAGEAGQERGTGRRDQAVEKLHHKCINNLHLACTILCNEFSYLLCRMMLVVMNAISIECSECNRDCKTRRGCISWWSHMGSGSWEKELRGLVAWLSDGPRLLQAGLSEIEPPEFDDCDHASPDDEQNLLAWHGLILTLQLFASSLRTFLLYYWVPPAALCGLLHDSDDVVAFSLRRLQAMWLFLEKVERDRFSSKPLATLFNELHWPCWTWVREIFVLLDEAAFESVPDLVRRRIRFYAAGWQGTHLIETTFQDMAAGEDRSANGRFSRPSQWYVAQTCGKLEDFDRVLVPETVESRSDTSKGRLSKDCFDAEGDRFCSLSDAQLGEITARNREWTSVAGKDWTLQPLIWLCMVSHEDAWAGLNQSWLSLLFVRNSIVEKRDDANHVVRCGIVSEVGANYHTFTPPNHDFWV